MIDIEAYAVKLTGSSNPTMLDPWKQTWDYNKPGRMEIREMAGIHLLGEFPHRLFADKYPTESDSIRQWIRDNYEPITKGPAQSFVRDCARMFSASNWSVSVDDETRKYIESPRWDGKSFRAYFASEVWPLTVLDANAVAVCMPTGEGLGDPTKKVDVDIWLLETKQIIERPTNRHGLLSWEDYEGNYYIESGNEKKGKRYWVLDNEWYYRIDQAGSGKNDYAVTYYYRHGTGTMLCQDLGGDAECRQEEDKGKGIIYHSFFEAYQAWGNDAITSYAHYKVVEAQMAHPVIEQYSNPCNYRDSYGHECLDGYMSESGRMCSNCSGTGLAPFAKPGEIVQRPIPSNSETDGLNSLVGKPLRTYYHPPVEGLNALWEKVEKRLELAKEAINKRWINQAQSGTAKAFDKESEYATFQHIASWEFGTVIKGILFNIVKLRFPNTWQSMDPEVAIPTDFNLLTESDLIDKLSALRTANAPASVYQESIISYIQKAYTSQPKIQRKLKLAVYLDPLQTLTFGVRDGLNMNRSATIEDLIRSNFVYSVINDAIFDNGDQVLYNPIAWWRSLVEKKLQARNEAAKASMIIQPLNPLGDGE